MEDDFPSSVIRRIQLGEGSTPVIHKDDRIEITLSPGLQFDVDKRALQPLNAAFTAYEGNRLVLTAGRNYGPDEQLVLRDIQLMGRPPDPGSVAVTVAVTGEGYTQGQVERKEVFHEGTPDRLYYEGCLSGYEIPEAALDFPSGRKLIKGDTLKIRFDGAHPSQDQVKQISKAFGKKFTESKRTGKELVFLYKGGAKAKQLVVPKFTYDRMSGQPAYIDYEIRSRDPAVVNVSLSRKVTYSKLSFAMEEYRRYEGVMDDSVLYIIHV